MDLQSEIPKSAESLALAPGTTIGNRYTIVKQLGSGAFGAVFQCRDLQISGLPVALKVFSASAKSNEVFLKRFAREMRVAFGINHDNLIRFYDPISIESIRGYTMEFAGNGDLSRFISPTTPIPELKVIEILLQICAGLEYLHRAGIVHRDLKPGNLLLSKNGLIKIGDFGLVGGKISVSSGFKNLALQHNKNHLTIDGELLGTPDYVSPEMLLGMPLDSRADLYALGVVAFELLTGRCPFEEGNLQKLFDNKVNQEAPELRSFQAHCSFELNEIVATLLRRKAEDRFQSAVAVKDALSTLQLRATQSAIHKDTSQEKRTKFDHGTKLKTDVKWQLRRVLLNPKSSFSRVRMDYLAGPGTAFSPQLGTWDKSLKKSGFGSFSITWVIVLLLLGSFAYYLRQKAISTPAASLDSEATNPTPTTKPAIRFFAPHKSDSDQIIVRKNKVKH